MRYQAPAPHPSGLTRAWSPSICWGTGPPGRRTSRRRPNPPVGRLLGRPGGQGRRLAPRQRQFGGWGGGGAGRGSRPVWSAGEASYSSPRPGRHPPDLPGAGAVIAVCRPGLPRRAARQPMYWMCSKFRMCFWMCFYVLYFVISVRNNFVSD